MMRFKLWLALCALGTFVGESVAIDPHLNAIQPRGAQRGTEAVVAFAGVNLNDAPEILVYYPGITVTKTEVLNKDTLRVTFQIAADCRLGEHAFRVRTSSGVSELRTFWVGALPVIDEKEPNTQFDSPQPIPLNVTVHGVIENEDVDYFEVECKKGQRLSVEIEGQRLGGTFFDPYVAILDSKRFEVAVGDDSPIIGQDGGCSVIIPDDGKYIIQVRESSYGGNGACQYRLHVGTFPRPTAIVPAGGPAGEEIEIRFIGDPAGEVTQKVKLPAAGDPLFRVHCETPDGIHPAGIKFHVSGVPHVVEGENANSPQAAMAGTAPGAFNGVISAPGENDYMKFSATKGQVFDIHCYARRLGSPLDPVMHIGQFANNTVTKYLAGVDDAIGPDSYLRFTVPEDGEYVIWVHDHLKKGGPDYFYRVELTVPTASTNTDIPRVDGNNVANQDRQNIAVPKGNRFAFMAVANRTDWGGPAAIGFDKLPPGVSFAADPVDPGLNQVPVVMEASPDAAVGGLLADLQAHPTDPNVKAASRTTLPVYFNLALNNTPFHSHTVNRVAVAVTEAVPFAIEVVEPKAPVVQNGSMNLKVIAKRQEGFTGPIHVYPLWTPPGMGIQGQTTIPENVTEVLIPINAAPNAAARKWKTAFIAQAAVTGGPTPKPDDPTTAQSSGPVWVSSQLFTLEVAPPMVVFAQERTAVEQGQKTQIFCKLTVNTPFEGEATAQIVGLPAKVTAEPVKFTKDATEIVFDVATDATSPAGKHGVFCQVVVQANGETIIHNVGGNELRIDVPIPKTTAQAPPMEQPKPDAPPQQKRLSRLEQLRLEQAEREKAAQEQKKE
jgi:hypothetical protein